MHTLIYRKCLLCALLQFLFRSGDWTDAGRILVGDDHRVALLHTLDLGAHGQSPFTVLSVRLSR